MQKLLHKRDDGSWLENGIFKKEFNKNKKVRLQFSLCLKKIIARALKSKAYIQQSQISSSLHSFQFFLFLPPRSKFTKSCKIKIKIITNLTFLIYFAN
jgi:hypothetical protein